VSETIKKKLSGEKGGFRSWYDDIPPEFGPEVPFNSYARVGSASRLDHDDFDMPKTTVIHKAPENPLLKRRADGEQMTLDIKA
jgi:hypothetical protein